MSQDNSAGIFALPLLIFLCINITRQQIYMLRQQKQKQAQNFFPSSLTISRSNMVKLLYYNTSAGVFLRFLRAFLAF